MGKNSSTFEKRLKICSLVKPVSGDTPAIAIKGFM